MIFRQWSREFYRKNTFDPDQKWNGRPEASRDYMSLPTFAGSKVILPCSVWTPLSIFKNLDRWHPMQKSYSRFQFHGNHATHKIWFILNNNSLKFLFQSEFEKHQYLTEERRLTLSNELNLSVSQIKVWFQVSDVSCEILVTTSLSPIFTYCQQFLLVTCNKLNLFENKRAKIKKISGVRNNLATQLMAQGLYNHCSNNG